MFFVEYKIITFYCVTSYAILDFVHQFTVFLLQVDLADFDKIVIFGVDSLMPLIEKKVSQDCDKKDKQVTVVACRFPLPNWQPFASFGKGIDQVWLYQYYPSFVDSHNATTR